ncbi:MAG: hypothetical protein M3N51_10710 [Actinomycetota bacterium]|nr:hypothetical protein [Actinomycetota bacterium]
MLLLPMVALALAASACDRGEESAATTTVPVVVTPPTTEPLAGATTTGVPGAGAGTAAPTTVPGVPDYTIVSRSAGENGDTVVVLLEPGDYTDRDIENVVGSLIERFAPIREAHIVDSGEAAEAVLTDTPSPEQEAVLAEHYFARLEDGNRLVFLGPYAEQGEIIIGS